MLADPYGLDLALHLKPLFGRRGSQELDELALADAGLAPDLLMARAGAAAFACLRQTWPDDRHIGIVVGTGNNAGDGYVLAALALEAGHAVSIVALDPVASLPPAAARAQARALGLGARIAAWAGALTLGPQVWVDALFGTGLSRPLEGSAAALVSALNTSGLPILSLDIPSGLSADTGQGGGPSIQATLTVSFIAGKPGLYTGAGPAQAGRVMSVDLGVPSRVVSQVMPDAILVEPSLLCLLGRRQRDAHKGKYGHVWIVGGDHGYAGAARLAGEAAARAGAGLVTLATRPEHAALVNLARPELMTFGLEDPAALHAGLPERATLALGPGLGRGAWGQALAEAWLDRADVVDADGLYHLGARPRRRQDWVLTPHPGEAAGLLGTSVAAVEADRLSAARTLVERYGGTCVLKGAGSVIASTAEALAALPAGPLWDDLRRTPVVIIHAGNPGMASGGMGDALTGIIAALKAQGWCGAAAAVLGALAHAHAADRAAQQGERGLLASDVIAQLRGVLNPGC